MPEKNQNNEAPKTAKRNRKRIRLGIILGVLTAIITWSIWSAWNSKSIEQRLAEIEAARAIPDSENVAILYNKLMQTPNATDLVEAWVEEKRPVVEALIEASEYEKCRFPIQMPLPANRAMRHWAFLLKHAVNDDIPNGLIDDAIDKWRCLLQMGNHLRQQALFSELIVAMAIEAIALNQAKAVLVQGNPDEAHLSRIERIKFRFGYTNFGRRTPGIDKIRRQYYELLARARGIHVLVALRRYKNNHGRWPETIDKIRAQVPEGIFLDPFGNALAYKLTEDGFTLYSKGPNKIDENGERHNGCDDCPIWVPKTPKKNEENADDK
ncbi:MAG: hypothetical protein ACYS8Z_26405 [Planctomycetota bacterium]|jgi:hypothetical protein